MTRRSANGGTRLPSGGRSFPLAGQVFWPRMTRTGRNSKDASLRPTVCSAETRPTRGSKPNVDGSISCLGRRRAALSLRDTDQLRPIELWFYSGEREYPEL